jgi:hypothetical protein
MHSAGQPLGLSVTASVMPPGEWSHGLATRAGHLLLGPQRTYQNSLARFSYINGARVTLYMVQYTKG